MSSRRTPAIADENEIVIEFLDEGADDFGRRRFVAYWLADNIGPACNEHGTRGQVFFTNPDEFVKRHQARDKTVRYLYELEPGRFDTGDPDHPDRTGAEDRGGQV